MPLSAQMDQRNFNDSQRALNDTKDALMGYALSLNHAATDGKPHLPCPDTDGDGMENRTGTACASVEGDLPWVDLGVAENDSWGNHYRYRVSSLFSDSAAGFTLSSVGNIDIRDAASGGNTVASQLPVLVLSRGKNGAGAGTDEAENGDADTTFVSHVPSATSGNEFDDLVVWLPSTIIFNRMVSAGLLP